MYKDVDNKVRKEQDILISVFFILDSRKYSTEKEVNCIRFFKLQTLSIMAMRKKIDTFPEPFQTLWERIGKVLLSYVTNVVDEIFFKRILNP